MGTRLYGNFKEYSFFVWEQLVNGEEKDMDTMGIEPMAFRSLRKLSHDGAYAKRARYHCAKCPCLVNLYVTIYCSALCPLST
jgi:hypothetical protein